MDWAQLIAAQSAIEPLSKSLQRQPAANLRDAKLVGALLELSELANTFAAFKYWKKSHVTNQTKLITECADSLTAFCALANELKLTKLPVPAVTSEELSTQMLAVYNATIGLQYAFTKAQLSKALALLRGLFLLLKLDETVINATLHERLATYRAARASQGAYGL